MRPGAAFILSDIHDFLFFFIHCRQPGVDLTDFGILIGLRPHIGLDKSEEILFAIDGTNISSFRN